MRQDTARYGMVKYVAEVQGATGAWFRVFTTGDARYYLFDKLYPGTDVSCGLSFPVEKKRLSRQMRSALHNGWGHARPERPSPVARQDGYGDWGLV